MTYLPGEFVYCARTSPLHLARPAGPAPSAEAQLRQERQQLRRTREFFRIAGERALQPGHLLPWGETVGEFCISYILCAHARRRETTRGKLERTCAEGNPRAKRLKTL